MPPRLGKCSISIGNRFKRAYKRLDPRIQSIVDDVLQELANGSLKPSRRLKKMQGHKSPEIYEVSLNDNFRMTFSIENNVAKMRNVDTHDKSLGNP